MEEVAERKLIDDYLYSTPPLHVRRTLDQYYYPAIINTADRDRDQVVMRTTQQKGSGGSLDVHGRQMIMVDQLWLWILDHSMCYHS